MPTPANAIGVWIPTANGCHCADISTLEGNGSLSAPVRLLRGLRAEYIRLVTMPNGKPIAWDRWTAHRDGENDITHWTYADSTGSYTVFND